MLGNGDGTFQPPMDISTPYSPFALGVGDFNGDGKLDLAVGGQGFDNPFEVEILLGNGDGTFQEGADYALPAFAESISVADFRGSGKLDLAIATEFGAVPLFLGNGDGTFESPTLYFPPAFASNWVTAADFDGDGIIDIAVANFLGPPGISVFLGDGDGTFRPATMYHAGSEPRFVAAADFNGDHKTDLVATDYLFNHVNVLLNTGVVGFSPMTPVKFSPQLLNTTSSPQAVILTNRGASTLSISSISVQGQFSLNSGTTCSTSVAPGASCAISVAFKPLAIGNKNGTVTILDTASSKPQVIELTGAGTVVSLSPAQLNFPPQKVGGKSAPLHVTVTNEGATSITFSSINLDGTNWRDFSEINTCTAQQLQAGASCTVTVTFSPTKTGQRTATVFIYDDGGGTVQSVALTGRGT